MRDYKETSGLLRGLAVSLQVIDSDYAQLCDDGADAIEELLGEVERAENRHVVESEMIGEMYAEIERLKAKVPTWISVEERLPETAYRVLTCSGEYVTENMMCTTIDVEGKHLVWAFRDGLVTHWMPLPTSPGGAE